MEDQNNFARVTSKQKKPISRLDLGKTIYKYSVFARSEFLRLVRVPNESRIILISYYMFKYSFRIKTTFLESLRCKKKKLVKPSS